MGRRPLLSTRIRRPIALGTVLTLLFALQILIAPAALAFQLTFVRAFGTHGSGATQIYHPYDVEFDIDGNVYVVDHVNHRIQVFDGKGNFLKTIGDGVGQEDGQLYYPEALALDDPANPGFLYVADTANNRIQEFDVATGSWIKSWGQNGSADGEFAGPNGIAVYNGFVYVTDKLNQRVQKFTTAGVFVKKWGQSGTTDGSFVAPAGISVTHSGVYVTDEQAGTVQNFSPDGVFIRKFGGKGSGDGQLEFPDEISACGNTNSPDVDIYVAEAGNTSRVSRFLDQTQGVIFRETFTGDPSAGSHFSYPHGVSCFPNTSQSDTVIVASTNESKIFKFNYDDVTMKIDPAESPGTLLNRGALRFKLSHDGMTKKCDLEKAKGYFEVVDGESIGLDDPVYSVRGGASVVKAKQTLGYGIGLSPGQMDAAKKAINKNKTIKVAITFHFDLCARGNPITVRYKIT
ncbi:MAG: tripartite motif-containing protein 71 [Actinomycetota bacterium]|nr:tripartite motif-containing protein 71 [Actinomycetota bacterium]